MNSDPDRARSQVVAYTGLDPALVKDMPLITWSYQVKPERWQQVIDLMTKTGELRKSPKLESFFAEEIKPYIQGSTQ